MLKAPGAASKSNENLSLNNHATSKPSSSASVGKTKIVPPSNPRRSLNVSSRKSLGLNTSALPNSTKAAPRESSKETEPVVRKGPSTRLSLVKPGSIAKPGLKAQQSTESRTRPGPMKALPTTSNIPDKQLTGKNNNVLLHCLSNCPSGVKRIHVPAFLQVTNIPVKLLCNVINMISIKLFRFSIQCNMSYGATAKAGAAKSNLIKLKT